MISLITSHLPSILTFLSGAATEYFGSKAVARIRAMHPGLSLSQDLDNKIVSIVEARLAKLGVTKTPE